MSDSWIMRDDWGPMFHRVHRDGENDPEHYFWQSDEYAALTVPHSQLPEFLSWLQSIWSDEEKYDAE